jgi:hyperosmotically inducible protein
MKTFISKLCSLRTLAPAVLAMSAIMLAPASAWSDSSDIAEVLTDTAITAQVKTKLLANRNVPGTDIEVNTDEGTVTLSGTVRSGAEKDLADCITKHSKGVEKVNNELTVAD